MSKQYRLVVQSLVAGLIPSVACGLGALPIPKLDMKRRIGIGYAVACGLGAIRELFDEDRWSFIVEHPVGMTEIAVVLQRAVS